MATAISRDSRTAPLPLREEAVWISTWETVWPSACLQLDYIGSFADILEDNVRLGFGVVIKLGQ